MVSFRVKVLVLSISVISLYLVAELGYPQ